MSSQPAAPISKSIASNEVVSARESKSTPAANNISFEEQEKSATKPQSNNIIKAQPQQVEPKTGVLTHQRIPTAEIIPLSFPTLDKHSVIAKPMQPTKPLYEPKNVGATVPTSLIKIKKTDSDVGNDKLKADDQSERLPALSPIPVIKKDSPFITDIGNQ